MANNEVRKEENINVETIVDNVVDRVIQNTDIQDKPRRKGNKIIRGIKRTGRNIKRVAKPFGIGVLAGAGAVLGFMLAAGKRSEGYNNYDDDAEPDETVVDDVETIVMD